MNPQKKILLKKKLNDTKIAGITLSSLSLKMTQFSCSEFRRKRIYDAIIPISFLNYIKSNLYQIRFPPKPSIALYKIKNFLINRIILSSE